MNEVEQISKEDLQNQVCPEKKNLLFSIKSFMKCFSGKKKKKNTFMKCFQSHMRISFSDIYSFYSRIMILFRVLRRSQGTSHPKILHGNILPFFSFCF